MTIAELDKKITIKHYTTVQDGTTGKTSTTLTASWNKWAKVEKLNGSRVLDNAAVSYKEAYKITVRYENSRVTDSKYNVVIDNKEMKIYSVVPQNIGRRMWEIITAYV